MSWCSGKKIGGRVYFSEIQNSHLFNETELESEPLDGAVDLQDLETVGVVQGQVGGNPEGQLLGVSRNLHLERRRINSYNPTDVT